MTFIISTDQDGQIQTATTIKQATAKIIRTSKAMPTTPVYLAETTEQEGDQDIAEYLNGKKVRG